jgi:hypothetical protein
MSKYQYIITAPKLDGLSVPEIDRLDLLFGSKFSRYADSLTISTFIKDEILGAMEECGLPITEAQFDNAFSRFQESYEIYDERWIRHVMETWKDFDDLENWVQRNTKGTCFTGRDPGCVCPLDEVLLSRLIDYLKEEQLPVELVEEATDSLLDDIFSTDELSEYVNGHKTQYNLRILGAHKLENLLRDTDFSTTHIYIYTAD